MSRVLEHMINEPWAILPGALETMVGIVRREISDVDAIERRLGERHAEASRARVRDGVAVVPVHGPIARYANLFTMISGATSTELLATDIGSLLDDPEVHAIVLDIDSPGGAVNGTAEVADLIHRARAKKPIIGFASGSAASGAYWIGSAASELFASPTAVVGSLGAVIGMRKFPDRAGVETIEFVSAQSPKKRLDPFSDDPDEAAAASAEFQSLVNELADVFVSNVARFRGVSVDTVLRDYGQGGLLVGAQAQAAGIVDGVTTLEQLVTTLSQNRREVGRAGFRLAAELNTAPTASTDDLESEMSDTPKDPAATPQPITRASLEASNPELVAELRTEGATAERERVLAIQGLDGPAAVIAECVADPAATVGDAAVRVLEAAKAKAQAQKDAHLSDRAGAEKRIDAPGPDAGGSESSDDRSRAKRVVAIHQKMTGNAPVATA